MLKRIKRFISRKRPYLPGDLVSVRVQDAGRGGIVYVEMGLFVVTKNRGISASVGQYHCTSIVTGEQRIIHQDHMTRVETDDAPN